MKIQCDVCEKAPATVICCADEAALCSNCDIEVHAANKLVSKHQRLLLQSLSSKLVLCDICQEKPAFIFCVEDRALLCRDCDEPIHLPGSLSSKHQRLLVTGIRVASSCAKDTEIGRLEPPNRNASKPLAKVPASLPQTITPNNWPVDELLHFSDVESSDKFQREAIGFGELQWITGIGVYDEQVPQAQEALNAAEVPQLHITPASDATLYMPTKSIFSHKKPRIEIPDDEEYFIVPDLG